LNFRQGQAAKPSLTALSPGWLPAPGTLVGRATARTEDLEKINEWALGQPKLTTI